jgi:hypothetical protein
MAKNKIKRAWGWCETCKESKNITELYIDKKRLVVTLECGHEFNGNIGSNQ